jgi:hypothetical protein
MAAAGGSDRVSTRRVTVVTAGHLSTCPRMLKAADALHGAGYDVRVISMLHTAWAAEADRELHARRGWRWQPIACGRREAPLTWLVSGVRTRAARAAARAPGVPWPILVRAFARTHDEIVRAILREPQDLLYGGTAGALAALLDASRASGTPAGVDFEDYHCGEHTGAGDGPLLNDLAAAVMARAVREAAFVTAGSAAIAGACDARFGMRPIVVNNVFTLPPSPRRHDAGGPLRLYWFSQTIGPGRGLEDVIRAAGRAGLRCELHLRGVPAAGFAGALERLAADAAPGLRLAIHPPSPPDRMVDTCRGFDAGVATEQADVPNHALSLSNKALTYPLAGLAMILTDTAGQRPLAQDLGGDAIVFEPGAVDALADGLARWASSPAALRRAQDAAWEAARTRWHWEHALERGALLDRVAGAVA